MFCVTSYNINHENVWTVQHTSTFPRTQIHNLEILQLQSDGYSVNIVLNNMHFNVKQ
jgi:hypothetical protein